MPFVLELENFQGPFDLLLSLIDKQKLEITEVSLAKVTSDYLDYVSELDLTVEDMNSFLFVAAKLSLDKSRAIIKLESRDEEGDIDLKESLLRYQQIKNQARLLNDLSKKSMTGRNSNIYKASSISKINSQDLMSSFRLLGDLKSNVDIKKISTSKANSAEIKKSFKRHIEKLRSFSIEEIMLKPQNRAEAIIYFLSILELLKSNRLYPANNNKLEIAV